MSLYVIGDLHLSLASEKPMGIFGQRWEAHDEKIKMNWEKKIKNEDTVVIPGDIQRFFPCRQCDLAGAEAGPPMRVFGSRGSVLRAAREGAEQKGGEKQRQKPFFPV